jgi:hypothetical protein
MAAINPSLPIAGQPNSSEEPKIPTALSQLVATINNLDTANLADRAVTAVKIEAQQAWQSLGTPTGFSSGTLYYSKDSLGRVHLRGDLLTVAASNIPANTTLATLPAGYRPVSTQYFPITSVTNGPTSQCYITAAGVIAPPVGLFANGTYAFGAVSFRAEN